MKRNKFSLSNYRVMSMKMGSLIPCGLLEVLPGDTVQMATSALIRLSPLVAPVMHPCHARIHHWFVPNRLVWDNWENFITGGPDGMNASVFPTIQGAQATVTAGGLADYYGIPPRTYTDFFSALPFRGYAHIWNEWYRDQDLSTLAPFSKGDGADGQTHANTLRKVAWEKDYFTSARPWTQKGPEVTIPLSSDTAPVKGLGILASAGVPGGTNVSVRETGSSTPLTYPFANPTSSASAGQIKTTSGSAGPTPDVTVDLSNVTAATINELRLAFALQRYQEARARYGSRYVEYLRYLGVRSSDARLQRPEYLGGGKQTVQFSEILQTGPNDPENGQTIGALKGHGIGALRSNRFRRFIEEHGYIHSFISIKPITVYSQGVSRHWTRKIKEDYWQRELQHIGQQEVYNREIYAAHTNPAGVFGFQDRYDEYRRQESSVAGEFRSLLNYWHMAREFSADPVLNASFVESNPTNRIFADQTGSDTVYAMISHSCQVRRMVARNGTSFIY